MRKRVYIAGPISRGDLAANVNRATAAFVALAKDGFAPFCPHWSVYAKPCQPDTWAGLSRPDRCRCVGTKEGNEEMTHEDWLGVDLAWVQMADAVLRLPGESTGADQEVAHAKAHGIPVFTCVSELVEHFTLFEVTVHVSGD